MTPRPTQKQVAERAGVSQTVVSQVLNGQADQARIHPETCARVQDAIQALGYVPNLAARRLVGGRSSLIGVFTYEAVFPSSTRNFYAPFLEGIEEEASRSQLDLLLYTGASGKRRSLQRSTRGRLSLTDGTILLGHPGVQDRQELGELVRSGYPVVFIGRRELPGSAALPCVEADYRGATRDLTRHFMQQGHQHLTYLGGLERLESALDREEGFGLEAPGGHIERLDADALTLTWLRRHLRGGTTGFLVENDRLMRRLLQVAGAAHLHIPQNFSAAVLGDAITGETGDQSWTRFEIPRREMGRGAVETLRGLLAGNPATSQRYACRLLPGETVAAPPHNP